MTPREPLPISAFDFEFPKELVASEPANPRDSSRLMVIERESGRWEHRSFGNLPEYLESGDCLVLNDTKVFACRLLGKKSTGGRAEMLLVRDIEPGLWTALSSGLKAGTEVLFPAGLTARIEGLNEEGEYLCRFSSRDMTGYLETHGLAPLPPYILKKRKAPEPRDLSRYQTVYARDPGSIAAPTAGLHFTPGLLEALRLGGVRIARVTLHVGRGTFRPIQGADAGSHKMLPEGYSVAPEQAEIIRRTLDEGRRVVAVGTTSTRTLEALAGRPEGFGPGEGWTDLYIRPGHGFKAAAGLLTNFHLPRSTPLMLAAAFMGRERLLAAYREAFRQRYRLYSYGDAMLML